MQINSINNTSPQQTFGMAYYGPSKKKIVKEIGLNAAEQIESIHPQLESLARDKDIKISIIKAKEFASRGFKICVSDVITNPIKRYFGTYNSMNTQIKMGDIPPGGSLKDTLLARIDNAKKIFSYCTNE